VRPQERVSFCPLRCHAESRWNSSENSVVTSVLATILLVCFGVLQRQERETARQEIVQQRKMALQLCMWVAGVWYEGFRLTDPQASMTVASAASALWKP